MEMEINVNKMDRFKGKNKVLNYENNYCKIYKEIKNENIIVNDDLKIFLKLKLYIRK